MDLHFDLPVGLCGRICVVVVEPGPSGLPHSALATQGGRFRHTCRASFVAAAMGERPRTIPSGAPDTDPRGAPAVARGQRRAAHWPSSQPARRPSQAVVPGFWGRPLYAPAWLTSPGSPGCGPRLGPRPSQAGGHRAWAPASASPFRTPILVPTLVSAHSNTRCKKTQCPQYL